MLRKALAILLVASWLVFAAFDLLEDLDLAAYFEVYAAERSALPGFGQPIKVANNTLENGSRMPIGEIGLVTPPARENVAFQPYDKEAKTTKKNLKIYKLHSAFLI